MKKELKPQDLIKLFPDEKDRDDLFGALHDINISFQFSTDDCSKKARTVAWMNMLRQRGFTISKMI